MRKFIIEDKRDIAPFNEPARALHVLNKPLWLAQRDALAAYCDNEVPVESLSGVPGDKEEMIVHRDNLYFDEPFVDDFIKRARKIRALNPSPSAIQTESSFAMIEAARLWATTSLTCGTSRKAITMMTCPCQSLSAASRLRQAIIQYPTI